MKPLSFLEINPIYTMFNIAKAQLSCTDFSRLNSSHMNISEGNMKAIVPLLDTIKLVAIETNELLKAEFYLKYKEIIIPEGGFGISVST